MNGARTASWCRFNELCVLRSGSVEEIGQARGPLPRVSSCFGPPFDSGSFSASGGVHAVKKIASYIKRVREKYSQLHGSVATMESKAAGCNNRMN